MRVLIINKFLYPNGGSETYIFKLGEALEQHGHEVQYFGMEHEGRCVGNRVNAYTSDMDFHGGSKLSKLTYPIKTIYSKEARVQLRKVLDDFKPDVCHLNNFNYQLTPSIILEIVKWRKETGRDCKIIFTAHDYQLVCPNHMVGARFKHKTYGYHTTTMKIDFANASNHIIMDYSIHDAIEAGFNHVVFIIRKDIEKEFKEVIQSGKKTENRADRRASVGGGSSLCRCAFKNVLRFTLYL